MGSVEYFFIKQKLAICFMKKYSTQPRKVKSFKNLNLEAKNVCFSCK